ncbi:MAG: DUF6361 family protein [Anaeromyxobacter sp.]
MSAIPATSWASGSSGTPSLTGCSRGRPRCRPAPRTSCSFPGRTSVWLPGRAALPWPGGRARPRSSSIAALQTGSDTDGIIGAVAGEKVKRTASSTYWVGLGSWGIRRLRGTQDQYHRAFERLHAPAGGAGRVESSSHDGTPLAATFEAWDPALPGPPEGFPEKASFRLDRRQAEYLRDRITQARDRRSLLAHLVRPGLPWEHEAAFPWECPDVETWPEHIQAEMAHARAFSELMHGAALLYNLMLAQASSSEEKVVEYRKRFGGWAEEIAARGAYFARWSRADFWALVDAQAGRVIGQTRDFVDTWVARALGPAPASLADDPGAREQNPGPGGAAEARAGAPREPGGARALEWRGRGGSTRLPLVPGPDAGS